jgi:hypothetical protein
LSGKNSLGDKPMKFDIGDTVDKELVKVMVHEFSRCEIAFNNFINYQYIVSPKKIKLIKMKNSIKQNILIYNSYALFVQHLYEFFIACLKRDRMSTDNISYQEIDVLINHEINKIFNSFLLLIDKGVAPSWVNDRTYYDEKCPEDFGRHFRYIRNSLSHADYRRITGETRITLPDFYKKYHKYVILFYQRCREHWSIENREKDVDLGEVTNFMNIIHEQY